MSRRFITLAVLSSAALRINSYIFLRWFPAHNFPPAILISFIIYLASLMYLKQSKTEEHIEVIEIKDKTKKEEIKIIHPSDSSEDESSRSANGFPSMVKTLIMGLPTKKYPSLNIINIMINALLLIFSADLVLRTHLLYPCNDLIFSRVGYISDTTAKILIREPNPSQLPIYVSYREAEAPDSIPWTTADKIYFLDNTTDYTYPITLINLRPATTYIYSLTDSLNGTFTTAPPLSLSNPKLTFLSTSCMKPHFPYNPLDHPLTIPGLTHLSNLLEQISPSFMLFLGDFIYIDVPFRLGSSVALYRQHYRQVYASPSSSPLKTLPWIHVLDDHEIANDWDRNTTPPYPAAIDPYTHYHASINPPTVSPGSTYFTFSRPPASFFMIDTRTHRTPPSPSGNTSMLGGPQLTALLNYLRTPPSNPNIHFKIVVTSIPFTLNWRFSARDTWAGYPSERQIILDAMWDAIETQGIAIIILSGDRHEFAATKFVPPKDNGNRWGPTIAAYEFSVSPLNMFYLPVRTYWEADEKPRVLMAPFGDNVSGTGRDECVKYIPDGNSKFGALELEGLEGAGMGMLRYRLFVDGIERWDYVVTSPGRKGGVGRDQEAVWE
ncbi:MAG: hypothetical protein M1834_004980 [Cirrosporium novae-zelandiae]|nr:MAG: hypothetical protein M1834_004980 [Cirrosporium novae-zelandiae]